LAELGVACEVIAPTLVSSEDGKSNDNDKNNPTDVRELTGSLHIGAIRR
jgi:hypothetical protein